MQKKELKMFWFEPCPNLQTAIFLAESANVQYKSEYSVEMKFKI